MPVNLQQLGNSILQATWTAPLSSDDLLQCFLDLAAQIDDADQVVHVLFDITDAASIPVDAPVLAIRSKFLMKARAGRIAVIGTNSLPKILADVASRVTNKEIEFFPDRTMAVNYLQEGAH